MRSLPPLSSFFVSSTSFILREPPCWRREAGGGGGSGSGKSNVASSQEPVPRGSAHASSAAGVDYLALVLTQGTAACGRGVLEREILRLRLSGGCRGPLLRRPELQEARRACRS